MSDFKTHDWTDDHLCDANDATAAAASAHVRIYTGNEINALICEVQAWRRAYPGDRFISGPNVLCAVRRLDRKPAKFAGKKI